MADMTQLLHLVDGKKPRSLSNSNACTPESWTWCTSHSCRRTAMGSPLGCGRGTALRGQRMRRAVPEASCFPRMGLVWTSEGGTSCFGLAIPGLVNARQRGRLHCQYFWLVCVDVERTIIVNKKARRTILDDVRARSLIATCWESSTRICSETCGRDGRNPINFLQRI